MGSAFSTQAIAAKVNRQLQSSYKKSFGGWEIHLSTWEDGMRGCVANNFHQRQSSPIVTVGVYFLPDKTTSRSVAFYAKHNATPNAKVVFNVGGKTFTMTHPAQYDHNGYFFSSGRDADRFVDAIKALGKSAQPNKSFTAKDSRGRVYQFDARRTTEMVDYILRDCGKT